MAARSCPSAARALYQVFVQPALLATQKSTAQRIAPNISPSCSKIPRLSHPLNHHQRRLFTVQKSVTPAVKSDEYDPFKDPERPIDEAIGTKYVHHVEESGKFRRNFNLAQLLLDIPRDTHVVRQVATGDRKTPIVKIFSKNELRDEKATKLALKAAKSAEDSTKELEISWSIAPNDLEYRLKKMRDFLNEGRRVELRILAKSAGRRLRVERSTPLEKMVALVESIHETVESIPGAEEWKDMDGQIGTAVTLFFKLNPDTEAGRQILDSNKKSLKTIKSDREEKMKKKEEEKKARKERHEAQLRRNEARKKNNQQPPSTTED